MKRILLTAAAFALFAGCSTPNQKDKAVSSPPETVMITYRVKPGKEQQLRDVLARAWDIYRKEHLVHEHPHLILRNSANENDTSLIEVFTWVSHDAPDHAPDSVKNIWAEMNSLCEPRGGHTALEGGEVDPLILNL